MAKYAESTIKSSEAKLRDATLTYLRQPVQVQISRLRSRLSSLERAIESQDLESVGRTAELQEAEALGKETVDVIDSQIAEVNADILEAATPEKAVQLERRRDTLLERRDVIVARANASVAARQRSLEEAQLKMSQLQDERKATVDEMSSLGGTP